jgi:ribosomal 30S subunit maturation factor RimM
MDQTDLAINTPPTLGPRSCFGGQNPVQDTVFLGEVHLPPVDFSSLLPLGRLGRTFQLEGAMRFHPHGHSEKNAIGLIGHVDIEGFGSARIKSVRNISRHLVLKFSRIANVETARSLVNREVLADLAGLPPALEGSPYIAGLLGLPVLVAGVCLGEVTRVDLVGLNLLLQVATRRGNILLPLSAPYIHLGKDSIEVEDPPPGLLKPS